VQGKDLLWVLLDRKSRSANNKEKTDTAPPVVGYSAGPNVAITLFLFHSVIGPEPKLVFKVLYREGIINKPDYKPTVASFRARAMGFGNDFMMITKQHFARAQSPTPRAEDETKGDRKERPQAGEQAHQTRESTNANR